MPIFLTPTGYKSFIVDFRRQCQGRPAGTMDFDYTTPGGTIKSFRFKTDDEYLSAIKNSGAAAWRPLTAYEEHYSHMGLVVTVTQQSIITAFNSDFTQPYDDWSANLRLVVLATSEAARSETVYRLCQKAIHGHDTFKYADVWGYLNTYDDTRRVNGIAANVFRALDDEHYGRHIQRG